MKRMTSAVVMTLLLTACATAEPSTDSTPIASLPDTMGPDNSTPTSTATSIPPTSTTTHSTTTVAPSTITTASCQPIGGTSAVEVGFPEPLSSVIGKDIRTGAQPCSERVVIELQPSEIPTSAEFPGYSVRYATGPIKESPSDLPVTIEGAEVLLVSLGSWMTFEGTGYTGPEQIFPANVSHIKELRLIENFEGMTTWAIGLDAKRSFEVKALDNPSRLVIDIQTSE
jgi:hypothetical protein